MKKFLTQQINFAYAMIVMMVLVLGVSSVSAGYATPGNLAAIDPIIHQGGAEQATDSLRLGIQSSPLGNFDVRGSIFSPKLALFDTTTSGGFFSTLYNSVFLGSVYISDDVETFIQNLNNPPNSLTTPIQQLSIDGDLLATSLENTPGGENVCVTKSGVLVICPDIINDVGDCGLSDGGTFTSPPSAGLCNVGTASSVTTNLDTYDWTCSALGGTDTCQADRVISLDAVCGASNGQNLSSPPTTGLCSPGNASPVTTNLDTYDWTCYGINGGNDVSCDADRILTSDAQCNTSFTGTYGSQPANAGNGCYAGTYNDLAPDDPDWIWECLGSNGGADDSCSAAKTNNTVNAQCNTSFTGTYTSQPADASNGCNIGTYQEATDDTNWKWNCLGSNGGTNDSCQANFAPVCTSYPNLEEFDPGLNPGDACTKGTYVEDPDSPTEWKWKCSLNGSTADCSAGIADGYTFICGTDPTGLYGSGRSGPADSRRAQWTRGILYSSNSTGDESPYTTGSKDCSGAKDIAWITANPHTLPSGSNPNNPTNDGYDNTMTNPVGGDGDTLWWKYFCFTEATNATANDCFCNTAGDTNGQC